MKKLYIMRHTQKDDSLTGQYDFDMKLTPKGIEDANSVGKKLFSLDVSPDLIVSSPSLRTKTTAEIIAKHLEYKRTIMYNEVIYQAFLNELLESITYTFDNVKDLFVIGHNPSLAALALTLVGYRGVVEMGTVIEIEFDTDSWIDIGKHNAKLVSVLHPEDCK